MEFLSKCFIFVLNIKTMVGIYKIQNKISGKLYIGSSYNIRERLNNHKSMLRCNRHHSIYLQRAYDKYGIENFIFKELEECKLQELMVKEQYYINKYDFKDLYNILPKSSPGFCKKHKRSSVIKSQRSRGYSSVYKINLKGKILKEYDLISDINIKASRVYLSIKKKQIVKNKKYGFVYSKDYYKGYKPKLLKIWNKNKSYKMKKFDSYPIYMYNIYGDFIKKFDSLRDCSLENNIAVSNLHRSLNNFKFRNRKHLFFTKLTDFNNKIKIDKNKLNNDIIVLNVFDEKLGYSTIEKVSKIINCSQTSIKQVLNNKRNQCKGYKFQML